jgi:hypothetical protein
MHSDCASCLNRGVDVLGSRFAASVRETDWEVNGLGAGRRSEGAGDMVDPTSYARDPRIHGVH